MDPTKSTAGPDSFAGSRRPRKKWLPFVIVVIAAAIIAAIAYWLAHSATPAPSGGRFGGGRGGGPGGLTMPVGVATVATGDIDIVLNALGTVTPLKVVTVNTQTSGQLQRINFKEGQMVAQGDVLAEIDPRPLQAALAQAEGTLARDNALLANAKIDRARYETLFKQDSIAKQQLDSQISLVHQYEGTIKSDQGQIETAKVNLNYTKVLAPAGGRVGLRQVDAGNNVQNGATIVVITQLKPIDVLFTIPEDNLRPVLARLHGGTPLEVDVYDRAGQTKLASGSLASLDNQIDTTTGTVKAKAQFVNDDESLFPNQFVNVRLLLDVRHGVLVIPTSALERGADGLFVYIVQPDKTVKVQDIKTGATEGERVEVTEGLKAGDVVVTSGADRLREGSKISLPEDEPAPAADSMKPDAAKPDSAEGQKRQWKRGEGQRGQDGQRRRRDGSGKPGDAKPSDAKPSDGRQ